MAQRHSLKLKPSHYLGLFQWFSAFSVLWRTFGEVQLDNYGWHFWMIKIKTHQMIGWLEISLPIFRKTKKKKYNHNITSICACENEKFSSPQQSSWQPLISSSSCSVFYNSWTWFIQTWKKKKHRLPNFPFLWIHKIQQSGKSTPLLIVHILVESPYWHVHLNVKLRLHRSLHQVCVCVFVFHVLNMPLVWIFHLNVSTVTISFTWTLPHLLGQDKPVFTASTKCFPSDDHTSNMPDLKRINC